MHVFNNSQPKCNVSSSDTVHAMGNRQSRNESREDHGRVNRTVREAKRITKNEAVKPVSIVPVHLSIILIIVNLILY